MIVVLGAFGRTGRIVAQHARAQGHSVRLVTRNAEQKSSGDRIEIACARLTDDLEVARALSEARAVYAILPDDLRAEPFHARRRRMADTIARAIHREQVPRVVLPSSTLAALGERTKSGFGADLAYFERVVLDTNAEVTILRATYFQDNLVEALAIADREGIFANVFSSRDVAIPMVASVDVGTVAARSLLEPRAHRETIDLVGPSYTPVEAAAALGAAVGRKLSILDLSPARQEEMFRTWMSVEAARAMVQTIECIGAGRAPLRGDRVEQGETQLDDVLRSALDRAAARLAPEVRT